MLPNFGICCRELGNAKLRVFAHTFAVSGLSCNNRASFVDYGANLAVVLFSFQKLIL